MNRRFALKTTAMAAVAVALTACAQPEPGNDIVDIAAGNPDFSTLVTAVRTAGLVDTLKGPGPFTVFAPTDAAFAALPAGTVERLLQPENRDRLTQILTHHVVPGRITSDRIVGTRQDVATVQGQSLRVDGTGGKYGAAVRMNNANVIAADVTASNGVIHVIDKVLLPR